MTDQRIFKLRRKSDGQYATRKFGGVYWSKLGTMWRGLSALRKALDHSLKDVDFNQVDIVLFEIKETGILPTKDLLY